MKKKNYILKEEVQVRNSPVRNLAAWIGGTILSSIGSFNESWITKEMYEESGSSIIHENDFYPSN